MKKPQGHTGDAERHNEIMDRMATVIAYGPIGKRSETLRLVRVWTAQCRAPGADLAEIHKKITAECSLRIGADRELLDMDPADSAIVAHEHERLRRIVDGLFGLCVYLAGQPEAAVEAAVVEWQRSFADGILARDALSRMTRDVAQVCRRQWRESDPKIRFMLAAACYLGNRGWDECGMMNDVFPLTLIERDEETHLRRWCKRYRRDPELALLAQAVETCRTACRAAAEGSAPAV